MIHLSILLIPFFTMAMLVYYMHCFNQINVLSKVPAAKTWRSVDLNSLDAIHTELYRKEMELFSNNRSLHYVFGISLLLSCFRFDTLLFWVLGFAACKFIAYYEKKNYTKLLEDQIYDHLEPLLKIPLGFIYKLFPHLDYDTRYYNATKDTKF